MGISIENLLRLPCLREAEVLAGRGGLSNNVGAVNVLEYSSANELQDYLFNTVEALQGELVLSCFAGIKDDVQAQCVTLTRLAKSGEAGLILYYVGIILPKVDEHLIQCADSLDFPLIAMPPNRPNLRYSEVITEVMQVIFKEQMSKTRFQTEILERISRQPVLSELVRAILQDEPLRMRHIASIFNIDVVSLRNMVIVTPLPNDKGWTRIEEITQTLLSIIRKELSPFCKTIVADMYSNDFVAFSDDPANYGIAALSHTLSEALDKAGINALMMYCLNLVDTAQVRQGYLRYRNALQAATLIYPQKKVFSMQEINFAEHCRSVIQMGEEKTQTVTALLGCLGAEDGESKELADTLATYLLDANGSPEKCAALMYRHPNSIRYRLNRCAELLGFKINSLPETFEVYQALALKRILRGKAVL